MTQVEPIVPHPTANRNETLSGMLCVDTSGNPRIPILMEMVAALSRATEPKEVLRIYAQKIEGLFALRGYISISTRGLNPGQYKVTRFVHQGEASQIGESDPWFDWEKLPIHTGGFFGEIIRNAYPELIHNLNIKNDAVFGNDLESYGSLMAIPLFDDGEPLKLQIEDFLASVRSGTKPSVDVQAGFAAVRTANRIVEVARKAGSKMI